MIHRGRTVLAMDCALAGAEWRCGRSLNSVVSRHPMSDDLWSALDNALTLKRRRDATVARLNQLLQKRFPDMPDGYLTAGNCELSREMLTAVQLQQFNPRHDRTEPHQMNGPLVVFEQRGERYLFDGTNRLNVWLRDGDAEEHETIIVKRMSE